MQLPLDIIWKIILAMIVGGLIGAEREYRSKSAGFRTMTLICMGSAIFTIFSCIIGGANNPDRIASNIITGIGFVGAGVIFKGDIGVNGITTASMIWVTAALGMAIGAGYELVSTIICLIILAMLLTFGRVEIWIDRVHQTRNYRIISSFEEANMHKYEKLFKENNLRFVRSRQIKSGETIMGEWIAKGSHKNHLLFIQQVLNDPSVRTFEY